MQIYYPNILDSGTLLSRGQRDVRLMLVDELKEPRRHVRLARVKVLRSPEPDLITGP